MEKQCIAEMIQETDESGKKTDDHNRKDRINQLVLSVCNDMYQGQSTDVVSNTLSSLLSQEMTIINTLSPQLP